MSIIVTSQAEWDAIPENCGKHIHIRLPKKEIIIIRQRKGSNVTTWDSIVVARDNSFVEARGNSLIYAYETSSVIAQENSSVIAWRKSTVSARENSSIEAYENSSVTAWENSFVVAYGNSPIVAYENSSVVAYGNSFVETYEKSSVEAYENSSVVAHGNSTVTACGNAQIVKRSDTANLTVSGNARIVKLPETPQEYCDFYGIDVTDGNVILYKAVRDNYASFHDANFVYSIGETKTNECDPSTKEVCSYGLHVSHLHWAIKFGRQNGKFKILKCAVPIDEIVVPKHTDGKVRTSELTVLGEVSPEEWGVCGKNVARQ